jgi:hypothetical protein
MTGHVLITFTIDVTCKEFLMKSEKIFARASVVEEKRSCVWGVLLDIDIHARCNVRRLDDFIWQFSFIFFLRQ